jgi:hypothetical protein
MNCRLCQKSENLVKAHVIPEAFFRELRDLSGETPILISGSGLDYPKRVPIGVYDSTILCQECENRFSACDDYAIKVLLHDFDNTFIPLCHEGRTIAYRSDSVDQATLLKFFVATLWRSSVSTHSFYSKVNLGPVERIAKGVFLDQSPHEGHRFSTILSRWEASAELDLITAAMISPFHDRWDGTNGYRFYFGRIQAYIKTDKRPYKSPLSEIAILAAPELIVIPWQLDKSNDFRALATVAHISSNVHRGT